MSGDISDSAKVGIGVLLLCFLIGIVFNVFTMVRSTATKGTNQLQGSMNQMVDATYAAYDNETVFGTSVLNAIATYGQDKMCIVVDNTKSTSNNLQFQPKPTPVNPTGSNYKSDGATGNTGPQQAYYYGYQATGIKVENDVSYITGSLVLDSNNSGSSASGGRSLDSSPTKELGVVSTYVNTQNRYASYLIKDSTAQIIGIYFKLQQS